MTIRVNAIAVALLLTVPAAHADGVYYGVGFGYADSTSEPEFGDNSSGGYPTIGATLGYKREQGNYFYAGEIDIDVPVGDAELSFEDVTCDDGFADGPYFCTHTSTVRLRSLAGVELSNGIDVFGTIGIAFMSGEGAIEPTGETDTGTASGATVGFGAQIPVGSGSMRLELIYDNLENTGTLPDDVYEPTFESVSLKTTYLF
ncbi:outer membrane protein with beta-barrel domain [Yoonia maricola]|uniref:Outer membrane protein with beta-barrel domain n=1 Tax=Yoonia maricola TaxID=420999 RepID=A0A2M8W113_9RHOB|nr:outer membrane beta-barrel protein [Yoonia maricola]PJI84613.1 outer membrane protein with beta-barrel domain [Yoonia maricola]